MPIAVVRPTAIVGTLPGEWSRIGGTSHVGAITDESDNSYLLANDNTTNDAPAVFGSFGVSNLPANAVVLRVRMSVRASRNSGNSPRFSLVMGSGTYNFTPATTGTINNYTSEWYTKDPRGANWRRTLDASDGTPLRYNLHTNVPGVNRRVHEVRLDVDYTVPPTTNPTVQQASSGTVSSTTFPTINLGFNSSVGSPKDAHHILLYSAAADNIIWDSGEVQNTATFQQVGVSLANGSYTAYVIVRQQDGVWSQQGEVTWTQNVSLTGTPTITVEPHYASLSNKITVQTNTTPHGTRSFVERKYGDEDWHPIAINDVEITNAQPNVFYDPYVPFNTPVSYRAMLTRNVGGGAIGSLYSAPATTQLNHQDWAIKDYDVDLNSLYRTTDQPYADYLVVEPEGEEFSIDSHEDMAVFRPLSRSGPIVVTDVIRMPRFDLTLGMLGNDDFNKLTSMRRKQRVMVLVSPMGHLWYFRFGPDYKETIVNMATPYRRVGIEVIAVDRPAPRKWSGGTMSTA